MATVISPPEAGIILENISWETYQGLLADHSESAGPRFTYDNGMLELMILSRKHEQPNRALASLVEVLAEEFDIDILPLGSTTFRREDLLKGFEPDSCFYIQNLAAVENKDEIDLSVDPPPDLVIEVDNTNPSLPRFPIFAAVGVPEVWRYDGGRVSILRLAAGEYVEAEHSPALPPLTSDAATRFVTDNKRMRRTAWLRGVRAWARAQIGGQHSEGQRPR